MRKEDGVGVITMGDGTQEDLREVADIMASEIKEKIARMDIYLAFHDRNIMKLKNTISSLTK